MSPYSPERILRIVSMVLIASTGAWLVWFFSDLVIYLLISLLLAYLLSPLVDRLEGTAFIGRGMAILITYLLVIAGISYMIASFVPFLARQISDLVSLISQDTLYQSAQRLEDFLREFIPVPEGAVTKGLNTAIARLLNQSSLTGFFSAIAGLFTNLFYALVVIPFATFFFLRDGYLIRNTLFQLVPNRYFEITLAIIAKVKSNLGRYFRGILVEIVAVSTVATLTLSMIGLESAVVVGLFTGIANTIPYFGPLMGFLAGTLVGLAQTGDFSLVPGVTLAMAITQLADNIIFQPFIFSKAARMHPLVILLVVLMGAQLAGIVGMLIAIPTVTIIRVLIEETLWSLRNYRIFYKAAA